MSQNRETGAAANQFGKQTARKIAALLKVKRVSNVSNEVLYESKRAVIKSAHLGNGYIGVTLKMLERIKLVIAVFETIDGNFDLYSLNVDTFKDNIRIGHHKHIAMVRKKVFLEEGRFIKTMGDIN